MSLTTTVDLDPLVSFEGADKVYSSGFRALAPIDLSLPRAEITSWSAHPVVARPHCCGWPPG
jgi:hypothetical protein